MNYYDIETDKVLKELKQRVLSLTKKFPISKIK